jgi:TonB family protein
MKHEDNDREINALYQQRKQQVQAPEINLTSLQMSKKPRYTIVQLLIILFFGGAASFGILAVISHFSAQPNMKTNQPSQTKWNVVELEHEEIKPIDEVIVIPIPPLVPPKPSVAPIYSKNEPVHGVKSLPNTLNISLPVDVVIVSIAPTIKQPALSLVPIYQEQPKYSHQAIRAEESGMVKLAYMISPQGNVSNITTVESSVNRELSLSARKALSKWRYLEGEYSEEGYEIIFDFTLEKKN